MATYRNHWEPCSPAWLAAMPEGACSWAPRRAGDGRTVSHYHPAVPVPPPADQTADDRPNLSPDPDHDGVILHLPETTYLDTQVWAVDVGLSHEALRDLRAVLAVLPEPTDRAAALPLTAVERQFLTFALDLAFDRMVSDDGFTADDEAALETLRRMAAEEQPAETETADRPAVLLEIATTLDGLAETDMIRKRRSLGTARRLLAVELRRMAEEQTATEPAVGEQPETQEMLRCVCGDPIEWWTGPNDSAGWIHSPGSKTPFPDIHKPRPVTDQQP